jgi:hypothetical protein|tara:strand:+ start:79 stop:282 length:204 start_codon:yes stop_codon:yes gene_type:complete
MNAPHRIVIEKSADEWIVRDRLNGDDIRIGSAPNIRTASDLAADFVTAYENQERKADEPSTVNNSDQ